MQKRVTLREIAEATGYSVITVSKALRNHADIAPSTRKYIHQKAKEMGYVINGAANALRSGRSMCIALSVVNISNSFWSMFARHAELIARNNGYSMIILNVDMCIETEGNAIRTALRQGVDGMLIDPSPGYRDNVKMLENLNIPFVILEHPATEDTMNSVTCDQAKGVYLMTKYMLHKGCRKVLFLNIEHFPWRREAFYRCLYEENLSPDVNAVYYDLKLEQDEIPMLLERMLTQHPDIDSVFAFNDIVAFNVIAALKQLGKSVPKDIKVVGNGDTSHYFNLPFDLTSIRSSPIELAENAMHLLIDNLNAEEAQPPKHIVIPVTLSEGESC